MVKVFIFLNLSAVKLNRERDFTDLSFMQIFRALFEHLSWKDFFDIFVVAFLFYQGLLIIRGTRALQVLTGIGLLMIVYLFGVTFKFHTLTWILEHFFGSFFILLIILFQDQIRLALADFGKSWNRIALIGGKTNQDVHDFEEVVHAAQAMSKEKIGALIVFERVHGLMNYIASGTQLNSELHSDVLYALFQSRSPLHDGAVIIVNGKIAAAGCFLPLSDNSEIERHLGTRHRAAMGMTELTDAVAVVVSEETGSISVCVKGHFTVCADGRELRRTLSLIWREDRILNLEVGH